MVGSSQVIVTAASVKTVLKKILKDTVQYGMFLGSFSGGYVALEEGIALGMGLSLIHISEHTRRRETRMPSSA